MKRFAVRHHATLDRRGSLDAVGRGRGRVPDYGDTSIRVGPEAAAAGATDAAIPGRKLGDGDAVLAGDDGAALASGDEVEGVTVVHHVGLRWRRRGDAVSRSSGRGLGRRRRRRRVSDDRDADVGIGPEAAARASHHGVPGQELRRRDAVCSGNGVTARTGWHEVEGIAIVHHTVLDGLGGLNPIAWLGGRRRGGLCNRRRGRWGRRFARDLNAVAATKSEVPTVGSEGGIL